MPHVRVSKAEHQYFHEAYAAYRRKVPDASVASWMRLAMSELGERILGRPIRR